MNSEELLLKQSYQGWRWRFFATVFDVFMYIFLNLGLWHKSVRPGLRNTDRIRNVSYGPHKTHRLDIYRPKSDAKTLPVVMYIHGGGFGTGSRRTHRIAAEKYAQLGYLVFNIDYRLAPEYPYPSGAQDVCLAYAWLVAHASDYGGDVARLSIAGESAGGNLTATVLLGACWKRPEPWLRQVWDTGVVPRAFQVICAYLHVSEPQIRYAALGKARSGPARFVARILNSFALAYMGRNAAIASEENLLVDIVRYLDQAPPPDRPIPAIFAPVGRRDVIKQDTFDFAAAMRKHGATVDERHYSKEPHAFQLIMNSPHTERYWQDCADFMQKNVLDAAVNQTTRAA